MYLCFRAGDVIRVYSRDERGWWDGEVANATEEREGPRRGWFPSNYVREMGWDGVSAPAWLRTSGFGLWAWTQ
jgi:hypothetical protein